MDWQKAFIIFDDVFKGGVSKDVEEPFLTWSVPSFIIFLLYNFLLTIFTAILVFFFILSFIGFMKRIIEISTVFFVIEILQIRRIRTSLYFSIFAFTYFKL